MAKGGNSQSFKKYSPTEHSKLWNCSKQEIIEDIARRNGVQKRKLKQEEYKPIKDPKVRVILRMVASNGSKSYWYYLKVEGHKPFTTKIPVDIRPIPSAAQIKRNPETWWVESKHRTLLEVEILSLRAFLSVTRTGAIMRKISKVREDSPVFYFLEALKSWGFDDDLIEKIELEEIGTYRLEQLCSKHFTLTPELHDRYWDSTFSRIKEKNDDRVESNVSASRKEKADNTLAKALDWTPDKPLDWLRHKDKIVMGDAYTLSGRFQFRYPKFAQRFKKLTSEKS
jgi:hypothetical protein